MKMRVATKKKTKSTSRKTAKKPTEPVKIGKKRKLAANENNAKNEQPKATKIEGKVAKKPASSKLAKNKIPVQTLPPPAQPTRSPEFMMQLGKSIQLAPFFTRAFAFSNHFKCHFIVDGRQYSCTEQFYKFWKARAFGDERNARAIMRSSDPKEMKRMGTDIWHFDTKKWRHISILVMTIGNMAKYEQNQLARKWLFETGNTLLVEASPDDIYWGCGIGVDEPASKILDMENWPGGAKNVMGRILTKIREHLKKKYEKEWEKVKEENNWEN